MSIDDFRLPPFHEDASPEHFENLDNFDNIVEVVQRAETDGVLTTLPTVKDEVQPEDVTRSRVNTIRTWLFLLDYLLKDEETGKIDKKLKDAVQRFQQDAGLTDDRWVGPKTWAALQQLVSFETPLNLKDWLRPDAEPMNPALRRALALRLSVYGLLPNRRSRTDDKLREALDDFVHVARVIGLGESELQPDFSRETLAALFDQDAVLKSLAFINPENVPRAVKTRIERFMITCAKIELWLHGYDVVPDGKTEGYAVDNAGETTFALKKKERKFYDAMINHWADLGRGRNKARAKKTANFINTHPEKLIANLKELFLNFFLLEQQEEQEARILPARVRTIRDRLFLLGYVEEETGELDGALKQAIQRFQQDAGLTDDPWEGPETWSALQQLVRFETLPDLDRWIGSDADHLNPALKRALALRLFAHGLLSDRHEDKTSKIKKALEAFVHIARVIGLGEGELRPNFSHETLAALFDQEAILQSLTVVNAETIPDKEKERVGNFMITNAKIELWLRGYNVVPDGDTKFELEKDEKKRRDHKLYQAMIDFWMDIGHRVDRATIIVETTYRETDKLIGNLRFLFLNAPKQKKKATRTGVAENSDVLYNRLIKLEQDDQESVWQKVKDIGSSVWDGVKRAWRWFKSLIKKGIKKAARWAKNLARLAFRFAHRTFLTIKKTVKAFLKSFESIWARTFPDSDASQLVIQRDGNFDYRLYRHQNADATQVQQITEAFYKQARIFRYGVHILGLVIDAVIETVKSAATVLGGWFGFILALVKMFKKFRELKLIVEESQAFLATI